LVLSKVRRKWGGNRPYLGNNHHFHSVIISIPYPSGSVFKGTTLQEAILHQQTIFECSRVSYFVFNRLIHISRYSMKCALLSRTQIGTCLNSLGEDLAEFFKLMFDPDDPKITFRLTLMAIVVLNLLASYIIETIVVNCRHFTHCFNLIQIISLRVKARL